MIRRTKLRTPDHHGGLLADPPLSEAPALLAANRAILDAWHHDFNGRDASQLRAMARRQVLAASAEFLARSGLPAAETAELDAPLIVTGHQPEPFHPGVWVKNFAAAAIACRVEGSALNLIVDNDVPKSAAIRVPTPTEAGPKVVPVAYDRWSGDVPYEEWRSDDPDLPSSFPDRVREALAGQVPDPILDDYWPLVAEAAGRTDRIGLRMAIGRRALEARWGGPQRRDPALEPLSDRGVRLVRLPRPGPSPEVSSGPQ